MKSHRVGPNTLVCDSNNWWVFSKCWGAAVQPWQWICLRPASSVGIILRHARVLASHEPRDVWCPAIPFCSRWPRPYQMPLSGWQRFLPFLLGCNALQKPTFVCARCFLRRLVSVLSLLGVGLSFWVSPSLTCVDWSTLRTPNYSQVLDLLGGKFTEACCPLPSLIPGPLAHPACLYGPGCNP